MQPSDGTVLSSEPGVLVQPKRVALSVARRKWVEDQVATAAGRAELQFSFIAQEAEGRRRREARKSEMRTCD